MIACGRRDDPGWSCASPFEKDLTLAKNRFPQTHSEMTVVCDSRQRTALLRGRTQRTGWNLDRWEA